MHVWPACYAQSGSGDRHTSGLELVYTLDAERLCTYMVVQDLGVLNPAVWVAFCTPGFKHSE